MKKILSLVALVILFSAGTVMAEEQAAAIVPEGAQAAKEECACPEAKDADGQCPEACPEKAPQEAAAPVADATTK